MRLVELFAENHGSKYIGAQSDGVSIGIISEPMCYCIIPSKLEGAENIGFPIRPTRLTFNVHVINAHSLAF